VVTNPHQHRGHVWACILGLLTAIAVVSPGRAAAQSTSTPTDAVFRRIYIESLRGLSAPDETFSDIEDRSVDQFPTLYAATSKTCSQRCSQRCSQGCTTSRGCSTKCKAYTEGCSGSGGSAGGSTTTAGTTTSTPPPASSAARIPRDVKTKYSVKDVQLLLQVAGYKVEADGAMNLSTQTAVANFQERNGLTATGVPDDAFWRALCVAVSALAGGSTQSVSGSAAPSDSKGQYWINSGSNTRHNATCRFYGTTKKGYYTNEKVGTACGICGG